MKLTARYLKPFWALVLICIFLLFGQAVSELALPNLMSSLVNVGIQQGGLEAGAPEAMSQKAHALLLYFSGEEEKALLEEGYYTIEPESSEAQRISGDYPLARREAVCLLREGLEPEARKALDGAFGQASYGFLLYMQEASAFGELEELALKAGQTQNAARPVLPDKTEKPADLENGDTEPSLPDGEASSVPEGSSAAPDEEPDRFSTVGTDPNLEIPDDGYRVDATDPNLRIPDEDYTVPASGMNLTLLPRAESPRQEAAGEPAVMPMGDFAGVEPAGGLEAPLPGAGESFASPAPGTEGGEGHEGSADSPAEWDSPEDTVSKPEFNGSSAPQPENPPQPGEPGGGNAGKGGFSLSENGIRGMSAQQLYQLLPLLELAPRESLSKAASLAAEAPGAMGEQVGVNLKKLFYEELGLDTAPAQSAYIWGKGLVMLGVSLLGALAAVLVGLFSSRIAAAVGKRLRHDLFSKVMGLGGPEFDKFSTASLITRTTNDVQQVQMLITMGLRLVCYAPIMGIGGVLFAVEKSVSMSWIVAAAVVVMLGLAMTAMALALPKFKALQGMMDALNRISREHLSGMMVVRAFGNQDFEEERFKGANQEFSHTSRFVQRVMAGMMPMMMLVMNLSTLVILWVGGHAIAESALQIGDMMAFIQYAMQIIASFLMIAMMFIMLPRASVSAERIREVLDMPLAVQDPESPEKPGEIQGVIEFKDVSFRYGDAESNVLEHISFTARPGETTAIIGATGAGKSTLINLIPRFYDVTEGEITLDGVDIRKYRQEDLRNSIGFVPQKALLFTGSVKENLLYGKESAGDEEVLQALEIAQAAGFVGDMEKGLDAFIAQGGGNVSGGQRQRLSMARALVRKAPVYIFDDSFSALDFKTEAALRAALGPYTEKSAVLIVAQRVSTIMQAEQILVLDDGRLAGKGTHKELLESCPVYREIAESQLRKEELV